MNKRNVHIISAILLIVLLVQAKPYCQKVSAGVNRNQIFIGEQFFLKLSVEQTYLGIEWFQFPDTLNHLEVVSRSKIDTVASGGYSNLYQTIVLTSFDSGRWQFPALAIASINQITMPITIDVMPVDVSKKTDYNEIKDIEEVLLKTNRVLIFTLFAITLFSLFMVIILIKKKKTGLVSTPILKGDETPLLWAMDELRKLSKPTEGGAIETKKYYSSLNTISRTFFHMQLHQNSLQQTTDEWMCSLQPLNIEGNTKILFYQFLRLADSVRFAKFLPPASENEAAMETVKEMLQKGSLLRPNIFLKYQPKPA